MINLQVKMKRYQSLSVSQKNEPGFALVATISVLVLLVLIALSMLTLSAVEVRSSQRNLAQEEAQSNARLALMLAIGELQKQLGPDQRISANSGILDNRVSTSEIDGVNGSSYVLGVWGQLAELD